MQELKIFLDAAAEYVIGTHNTAVERNSLRTIEFLSASDAVHRNSIYLLTEAELPRLAQFAPLAPAVFFIACAGEKLPALPENFPEGGAAVFVRGELLPIYTRLNDAFTSVRLRHRIDDVLLMCESMRYTPEQVIHTVSEFLHVGLFLLNGAYQIICFNVAGDGRSHYITELEQLGGLSSESIRRIRAGEPNITLLESTDNKWSPFSILLFRGARQRCEPDYLCERLADFIINTRNRSGAPDIPPFLVNQRINRVLTGRTTDEAEIKAAFGIRSGESAWYAILVLRMQSEGRWSPETYQMHVHLLRVAFRDAQVTVVQNHVCAVVRMPALSPADAVFSRSFFEERAYSEGWDDARLEQALKRFGVYVCRSSLFYSPSWYNFSVYFGLVVDTLDVALKLDNCRGRRLVDFQDYSSYITVKYSVDRFLQEHEPRNIRALLHPELVTLLHHDFRHHSDLATVLYAYYTYGDVQRTAQALFVHRNTVYNKLKTIGKILNADLDDSATRASYLSSLQIYYYCEKCLGIDMEKIAAPE